MARPAAHLIISTGLATLQWIRTGRLLPTIGPLLTGFLIDGDHLIDLVRYQRSRRTNQRRVVLLLHGWEYVPALALVERLLGGQFAGSLVLGYLAHLGLDQITNSISHPLAYLLSVRWRLGFPSRLFSHPDESHIDWMQSSIFQLWKHF